MLIREAIDPLLELCDRQEKPLPVDFRVWNRGVAPEICTRFRDFASIGGRTWAVNDEARQNRDLEALTDGTLALFLHQEWPSATDDTWWRWINWMLTESVRAGLVELYNYSSSPMFDTFIRLKSFPKHQWNRIEGRLPNIWSVSRRMIAEMASSHVPADELPAASINQFDTKPEWFKGHPWQLLPSGIKTTVRWSGSAKAIVTQIRDAGVVEPPTSSRPVESLTAWLSRNLSDFVGVQISARRFEIHSVTEG
jgi:hypothetical protein